MKWEQERNKLIKYIQEDKLSYDAIGKIYGCTGSNIRKVANKLGISMPKRRAVSASETFRRGEGHSVICLNCGKEFKSPPSSKAKFCCSKCSGEYVHKQNIKKWKLGELSGTSNYSCSDYVRRYLFEKYNSKCQRCGWGEVNPFTKLVPLQVHHIDGDSTNNLENNLQLLCPNCHSLTDNYGSRNTNASKGRSIYYGKAKAQ